MFKLFKTPASRADAAAVDAFNDPAARRPAPVVAGNRGRLVFAMDATLSRQPTWDLAIDLQSRMFDTAANLGGIDVQLVYFRGLSECRASPFVSGGAGLAKFMRRIHVEGGHTQIGRVLTHVRDQAEQTPVGALVYVGDAMEEKADTLCARAGELALLGVKAFLFQEGNNGLAAATFKEMARITGGAYAEFDRGAPDKLAALLAAAASYAAGGRDALTALASRPAQSEAARLLAQMR